jgi:hypothetical protein
MRKLAIVLTMLAALAYLGAIWRAFLGRFIVGHSAIALTAQGYWRATIALLLFAVVALLLERSQPKP